ncbi:hypothetical protein GYB62_00785 [bacterium]|nr:hypothetical protein [bacterium]
MIRGNEPGNPEVAVQSYIDALLGDDLGVDAAAALAEGGVASPLDKAAESSDGSALVNQLETLRQRQQAGEAVSQPRTLDARPAWGYAPIKCLLFTVGGLKLAIPAERVAFKVPLDIQAPKALDSMLYAEHAIGNLRLSGPAAGTGEEAGIDATADGKPVLNTAKLIMPERYRDALLDGYRYALALANADCCLAVDALVEEVTFSPQQVRWRSRHTRRQWLAGTIIERMCALLDADALLDDLVADKILNDIDE